MNATQDSVRNKPIYRYLLVQTFVLSVSATGWSAIYTNFAVEMAGIHPDAFGLLQTVRELPGLLALSLLAFLMFAKEMRMMSLGVLLCGLGTAATGFFPSFCGLLLCVFTMSLGHHYYEAEQQSLTLQHYSFCEAPLIIGRLRSVTAAGSFSIGAALFVLAGRVPYAWLFIVSGAGAVLGGIWGLTRKDIPARCPVQRSGIVIRKKYWLFYLMTFLSGARRQIFVVFSTLLLVRIFGFSLTQMTLLFLLNNLINWILNRYIGRAINAYGESRLLSVKYFVLLCIFIGYAHAGSGLLVAALYVLEQLFFNFTVSLRTFFQKIADPADIAPSMALGMTINHIAAVVVPVTGGILWAAYDFRIPFYMGAAFALASLICCRFVDAEIRRFKAGERG